MALLDPQNHLKIIDDLISDKLNTNKELLRSKLEELDNINKQISYLGGIDKDRENNIKLHIVEEPYTSGTSFLDNEKPIESNYNKERRISRGLFKTNTGKYINADVNAAYQIIKNVFCNVEIPADIGLVMNPVRINLC